MNKPPSITKQVVKEGEREMVVITAQTAEEARDKGFQEELAISNREKTKDYLRTHPPKPTCQDKEGTAKLIKEYGEFQKRKEEGRKKYY